MNKTQLRKFAATARKRIEDAVKQKAYSFGITKDEINPLQELSDGLIINGTVIGEREQKQYNHLKNRILMEGYETVMDEAAYTWFNRFVAMRYMEVNDFLPINMRILSSKKPDKREPDALTEILSLVDDLDLNRERVYQMKEDSQLNELYQYLLIKQSIKLGDILPNVFDPITDDLALLLPDNLLNENSVIRDIVTMVDEQDWTEVEIVGWLYQYYIADQKESFFSNRGKKAGKKDIPVATQLFTPKWIVKYMVDNSLGKYWLERYPDKDIETSLDYYLKSGDNNLGDKPAVDIEQLTFLDPSCGSGHILVYAFDVYYKLYLSRGYREREIPKLILNNNLFGLDIDKRAAQLATFALTMKAREYDRRLFSRDYKVHIHSIEESNTIENEYVELLADENTDVKTVTELLVSVYNDAKLYGSILQVPEIDISLIEGQMESIKNRTEIDIFTTELIEYVFPLIEDLIDQYKLLSKTYDIVVTNPPYMNNFNKNLKDFINKHYKDYKKDLFSVFIYRCTLFTKEHGYTALMTPMVWMFISSYEKLRNYIVKHKSIGSLVHLEYSAFKDATVPLCTFVLKNEFSDEKGTYIRLTEFTGGMDVQEEKFLEAKHDSTTSFRYETDSSNFSKIPGSPIAYWISNSMLKVFVEGILLEEYAEAKNGFTTGNNNLFLRLWHEVDPHNIDFHESSIEYVSENTHTWFPYNKGGSFRKWYGNLKHVINWSDNGREIKNYGHLVPRSLSYMFKTSLTWSKISSASISFRFVPSGNMFDVAGLSMFVKNKIYLNYLFALLNSKVTKRILLMLSPTLNFETGHIRSIPVIYNDKRHNLISDIVNINKILSKNDWNSFETSWDFEDHPFIIHKKDSALIENSFNNWEEVAEERFYQLKANEEELNRIFIDIYGLQDELTPEVEEKDVTVNKAVLDRDVKSFLSYLVGLMFGRYSLDKKGLAYAGGEWDESHYTSYKPDDTNIIPLTEDQYFEDDIMNKIEELVSLIYGKETLEENLRFIAEALKMKSNESARDRIRRYFMKEFYKDHLKTYQKRPIYWQFTSGKRGAFKGLMYLHRYHKYTVAQLRTEYILHQATVLDNLITHEQQVIADETSSATQKARAQKTIDEYTKDRAELAKYDRVIEHVARQQIDLDLDDGVKVNYQKFQNIEVTDDTSNKPKKQNVFEKI
ncbi:Methyltransferase domain-containing protein [Alkalibacterium subtropicum]|uniref:site-specific DNA-methyltransferase (adenine-specific) n=1 Tax=Alkalibacterium subtropicum TaxID=753702 RepID=A0A1I1L240_9LACT|nr:BREX-1 system adenine-specific DNA-methyltransferase PglX [Alkalibacterium subtropicum]SFC67127.1 Methyltransferase domain-containing protein [Alkalibacterium subtropicum]